MAGQQFVWEDVYKALHLGHSQASMDSKLFSNNVLSKLKKVKEWVDEPDSKHSAQFHNMKTADFKRYIEDHLEKSKFKCLKMEPKRKCTKPPTTNEDSPDGSPHLVKARKGKGKALPHEIDSDDMDG
jgi:hypothetical protein